MLQRRFRIENAAPNAGVADGDGAAAARHREVLQAIGDLQRALAPASDEALRIVENHAAGEQALQFAEARKLKSELEEIQAAIADTKREIATLHRNSLRDRNSIHVTDELGAIVSDTEQATETILSVAETIDQQAGDLVAALRGAEGDLARDIQEHVVRIFEACNFQDLTGQRITKVVGALKFIEERVERMMDIWGGLDGFDDVEAEERPAREGDAALLNGPALDGAEGVASQDDIDALFD